MPSVTTATSAARRDRDGPAALDDTYPSRSAARSTRSRVSARTARVPPRALDAVDVDTPASAATSARLGRRATLSGVRRVPVVSPMCMEPTGAGYGIGSDEG